MRDNLAARLDVIVAEITDDLRRAGRFQGRRDGCLVRRRDDDQAGQGETAAFPRNRSAGSDGKVTLLHKLGHVRRAQMELRGR